MRKQIVAEKGAPPMGIYSPAIAASGPMVFISGQLPVDPETGQLQSGSFEEQAKLTFDNVTMLLEAAGTSWEHAVKVGIFLADLKDFPQNERDLQRVSDRALSCSFYHSSSFATEHIY